MQQVARLLFRLKEEGIHIDVQDGQLALDLPAEFNDSELLSEIRQQKPDLLHFLGKLGATGAEGVVSSAPDQPDYPLTSSQSRLFFLQEMEPDSLAYNQLQLLSLKGRVETGKLEGAIRKLVTTHEALATSFRIENGEPRQWLRTDPSFGLEQLSGTMEEAIQQFQRPFNLKTDFLIRVGLLQLNDSENCLMIDTHHIICDGVSQGLLIRDLMKVYQGSDVEKPAFRLVDLAIHEQSDSWVQKIARQEEFWAHEFSEKIQHLALHPDFKSQRGFRGNQGEFSWEVSSELSQGIRQFAKDHEVTHYVLSYALLNVLFYKLSGNSDITMGTPVAGRFDDQFSDVVGMFVNTLALRTVINSQQNFKEYLESVKDKILNVLSNQEYPFDRLMQQDAFATDRQIQGPFEVFYAYRNYELPSLALEGLAVVAESGEGYQKAQFDLNFTLIEQTDKFIWQVKFDKALYDATTIDRWILHFNSVINKVLALPEVAISALDTLPEEERGLLASFNNTTVVDVPTTMLHLLEKQVLKTPENVAIVSQEKTYTFREIDQLSDRIARYLKVECDVLAGDKVITLMDRSIAVLPVLYGLLKAGAIYVPLAPEHPEKRITQIISDCQAKLVFKHAELDYELENISVIDLAVMEHILLNFESNINLTKPAPEEAAYIIYTSGSTGNPKGVVVAHQSLANKISWIQKDYPIDSSDVLLLKTPLNFDVSLQELFWWAASGAKLAILPHAMEKAPHATAETIEKYQVTTIHFVPSMLSVFFSSLGDTSCLNRLSSLRKIFCSGEALVPAHISLVRRKLTGINPQLINMYGPTETTIHDTHFDTTELQEGEAPPIGKLISNMRGYVLDPDGNLAPIGTEGDLYLSGIGVALGYHNRKDLTEAKFVEGKRFGESIMYDTGDRANVRKDGNLIFQGRNDFQVKLAGNRIELGEIERQLGLHNDVTEAAVKVIGEGESALLVAFYEAIEQQNPQVLEQFLLERIPYYMVPRQYIYLAKFPLTATGKTDRKKLIPPKLSVSIDLQLPKTQQEKLLVEAWGEVLSVSPDEIGVTQNFFQLGGTSLMLIKLNAIIKKKLQQEVSVAQLFNFPTIASLVNFLTTKDSELKEAESIIKTEVNEMHDLLGAMED